MTEAHPDQPCPRACKHCGREFTPRKAHAEFCCDSHRSAWHREHGKVTAGRVQSVSPTRDGAVVVVVRVLPEFSARVRGWVPGQGIDLVEGGS